MFIPPAGTLWRFMRILIQHAGTGLYLSKGKRWSPTPQEALAFLDEVRARDHCIYHRLTQGVVVRVPENHVPEGAGDKGMVTAASAAPPDNIEPDNVKQKRTKSAGQSIPKPGTESTGTDAARPLEVRPVSLPSPSAGPEKAVENVTLPKPEIVPSPRPEIVTTIEAEIDVGFGNTLFIRGQGAGLSWQKSLPLTCAGGTTWVWSTNQAQEKLQFKLLLNDLVWCQGEDLSAEVGQKTKVVPVFQ